jgi:predicted RNA-binding protein
MCLSSVYTVIDGQPDALIAKNVTAVSADGGMVVLVGLLGERTEVAGEIERVDFVKNQLLIRGLEQ